MHSSLVSQERQRHATLSTMIIAVDTGGTKTLIASYDAQGAASVLAKFPTPRDQKEYLDAVTTTISDANLDTIDAIVIALPGPIKDGLLQRSPNIGWQSFDVVAAIKERFASSFVAIGNDADLAGIAEARALEDPRLCLYVTLSTGIGTGLTYNGKLLPQLRRFEGGSMRIEYGGERSRWESIASGSNFRERYGQYGSEVNDPEKWHDYAERAASGLIALIPLIEPDNIVIGGSMGTHFAKYETYLRDTLNTQIAKHMTGVSITQAKRPEEAVIYGCYHYAVDALAR